MNYERYFAKKEDETDFYSPYQWLLKMEIFSQCGDNRRKVYGTQKTFI